MFGIEMNKNGFLAPFLNLILRFLIQERDLDPSKRFDQDLIFALLSYSRAVTRKKLGLRQCLWLKL